MALDTVKLEITAGTFIESAIWIAQIVSRELESPVTIKLNGIEMMIEGMDSENEKVKEYHELANIICPMRE